MRFVLATMSLFLMVAGAAMVGLVAQEDTVVEVYKSPT